jgi:hypothetical protein
MKQNWVTSGDADAAGQHNQALLRKAIDAMTKCKEEIAARMRALGMSPSSDAPAQSAIRDPIKTN